MGRSKAQQDIPATLALVSNTSMSTSKYEGGLKSLQMEEKQRLEKKFNLFLSCCLSPTMSTPSGLSITPLFHFEVCITLSLNPTEWLPAWPGLTYSNILPSCTQALGTQTWGEGNMIPEPSPDGY